MDPQLDAWRQTIEERLIATLDRGPDCPDRLREAMAYSLLGGGKRLRPLLVFLACEACGGEVEAALPAACAIEMVHTYSLIHDDLPAMDDDDQRRGRPTNHLQFDEATAILAGDALLTLAFEVLATEVHPPQVAVACCADLAAAAGMCGMVGGQMADVQGAGAGNREQGTGNREQGAGGGRREAGGFDAEGANAGDISQTAQPSTLNPQLSTLNSQPSTFNLQPSTLGDLESLHRRKTGRLLSSALTMGGRIGGGNPQMLRSLTTYGESIGLAFQIVDDLLDVGGDSATMGKQARKDQQAGKLTYPALLGEAESRHRAARLRDDACQAIAVFGTKGRRLEAMAHYVITRDR